MGNHSKEQTQTQEEKDQSISTTYHKTSTLSCKNKKAPP